MKKNSGKRYTRRNRLSDVIRLISVLSQGPYAFIDEPGIQNALRGRPFSASTWADIALAHPEFFRPEGSGTRYALLIRSYLPPNPDETRASLGIPETQKLIEVALSLHDKEIQRRQQNSYLFPLIIAVVALAGTICTPLITAWTSKDSTKTIDQIDATVQQIEAQLKPAPKNSPIK